MSTTIAVIAAHPDDEVVGAAGWLLSAGRAAVVHVTDGAPRDPRLWPEGVTDREAYARLRADEARAALAVAGLRAADRIALGAIDQEADRSLAPLARELAAILRALAPQVLVVHPLEGGHPDHDAAALAARAARAVVARGGGPAPRVLEMTSYHLRDGALESGAFLPGGEAGAIRPLDPAARAAKARMIACHASQRAVLAAFPVGDERWRAAAAVSLGAPPHPRPLLYEAMGWASWDRFAARAQDALGRLGVAEAEL
ncbi:PIG-L deacetylase family protein [Anaeromyxobacter oryzae]|uniref:LmbE family protein n=1 Tax=Anaeromyxobacter oryzae TaxID=2918170 RepID=A0ABN6MT42_9BACT|nr:PIG-L family deacetylase [Anaeromyxobacter oryzae]BDG04142.1 hypothetical protein AMOR_31380 [Anaeromyxobacter oryzae]